MTKKEDIMNTALYAGSFDPFTNGHLDILEQACQIFDRVIIAVANNSDKNGFLPVEKRLEIIQKSINKFNNVEIDSYQGLTIEYAKEHGIEILVRGARNAQDFEYELQISNTNLTLAPQMKTILLTPKPENFFISSTIVREIYKNGGDISKLVPYVWN
mgnify:CR=1 FL=1